ncbi:hypothetical protein HA385_24110, partial [Escherichia coli]|nr:hypothetical protein [Escherichia coli]
MKQAHVAMGNIHRSPESTLRRVKWMGVYWPSMKTDVYDYVRACSSCNLGNNPKDVNAITLYHM